MIVIYIDGGGNAIKLSPQHVYQGSNQTGVMVFAPVPTTTAMGIAFKLPDGTSTPYYPMTFIQSVKGLSQYEFTIPSIITQKAGQASIALQATFSDGQQTSQLMEFEIERSVLPVLPDEPTPDVYDLLRQAIAKNASDIADNTTAIEENANAIKANADNIKTNIADIAQNTADITILQGQIGNIEQLSEQAQKASANAVETANKAEKTANGLADSIAQANENASQAVKTADEAMNTADEAKETANGFAESIDFVRQDVATINSYIPSSTSAENQLADKAFVNSSINNLAAFYIEYNVNGDAFPTREALLNATIFYNARQPRVPTQNDYAYVLADESMPKDSLGNYPTTRYSYQGGTYPNGQWGFQYIVNNTSLTQAQVDAINSGITAEKIAAMDNATAEKYTKPASGIPESDLSASVQGKLNATSDGYIKNLYNLGAFDTYASNGDGTGTMTRKTGYREYRASDIIRFATWTGYPVAVIPKPIDFNGYGEYSAKDIPNNRGYKYGDITDQPDSILSRGEMTEIGVLFAIGTSQDDMRKAVDGLVIQYELATEYQYTEQVIENQPIHTLPQEGETWARDEWKKGLNLLPNSENITITADYTYVPLIKLKANTNYTVTLSNASLSSARFGGVDNSGSTTWVVSLNNGVGTFNLTQAQIDATVRFWFDSNKAQGQTTSCMLVQGTTPYPYIPYYGDVLRQIGGVLIGELINKHEQQVRGYQILPIGTDLKDKVSGLYSDAYEIYTKSIVVGEGGDKFCLIWNYNGAKIQTKVYNSGNLQVDGVIPYIEPNKLEPTTANGWTVGGRNLMLPSRGVFMLQINGTNIKTGIGIMFTYAQNFASAVCPNSDNTNDNDAAYSVLYNPSGWYLRNLVTGADITVTQVAYKKIA